jgi:hypothetical protein
MHIDHNDGAVVILKGRLSEVGKWQTFYQDKSSEQ